MNKTFYVYDWTFNAYENAAKHVHKRLSDRGFITDKSQYIITNDHPAGYDCICVEVSCDDQNFERVNTFMGNTFEANNYIGDRWFCPNCSVLVAQRYGNIYFDGDMMCGVIYDEI